MFEIGLKWLKSGSKWFKRLERGLKWLKSGSKWFKRLESGLKWLKGGYRDSNTGFIVKN